MHPTFFTGLNILLTLLVTRHKHDLWNQLYVVLPNYECSREDNLKYEIIVNDVNSDSIGINLIIFFPNPFD